MKHVFLEIFLDTCGIAQCKFRMKESHNRKESADNEANPIYDVSQIGSSNPGQIFVNSAALKRISSPGLNQLDLDVYQSHTRSTR